MCFGGGGGGSSNTTTQASIAPQLQPLFEQTGRVLQRAQMFQPWNYAGQAPFTPFNFFGTAPGQPPSVGLPPNPLAGDARQILLNQPMLPQVSDRISPTQPPTNLPSYVTTEGEIARQGGWNGPEGGESEADSLRTIIRIGDPALRPQAQERLNYLMGQAPSGPAGTPPPEGWPPGVTGPPGQLPGSILDEFLFGRPQRIPQATPGQQAVIGRQQQRAFGPQRTFEEMLAEATYGGLGGMRGGEQFATDLSSTFPFQRPEESAAIRTGQRFGQLYGPEYAGLGTASTLGELRLPELMALGQIGQFAGGEVGQSPMTQAAMKAVREPIVNELTAAGLGRSGALADELGKGYAPILAQELAIRAGVIPQLTALGGAQRGGETTAAQMYMMAGERQRAGDVDQANNLTSIANAARAGSAQAAQIQTQIADAQRRGDAEGAARLAELGSTLVARESALLGEFGQSAEGMRELEAMQEQAYTEDMLRRQQMAQGLTTGVLGGFPTTLGQSSVTRTRGGGGTVICTFLYDQGLMDEETYKADQQFGASLSLETIQGYHLWAIPLTEAMRKSKLLTKAIAPIALLWAKEMRARIEGKQSVSKLGRILLDYGIPICGWLGHNFVRNEECAFNC